VSVQWSLETIEVRAETLAPAPESLTGLCTVVYADGSEGRLRYDFRTRPPHPS
jgi:hypothetical protein